MSKELDNRLATIEGHIKSIRKMLVEGKQCEAVLLQLSAVEASIKKVGKKILRDHLEHCVKSGIESGDVNALGNFSILLEKYL